MTDWEYALERIKTQFNLNDIAKNTKAINGIFDAIYPKGSIYFTAENINPSQLFGGVWQVLSQSGDYSAWKRLS